MYGPAVLEAMTKAIRHVQLPSMRPGDMRMRTISAGIALASGVFAMWTALGRDGQAQAPPGVQSVGGAPGTLFSVPAARAPYSLEDALLRWPLPAGGERYAVID